MLTFQPLLESDAPTSATRKAMLAQQGRGHDQHGGPPDRLLRIRVASVHARRAASGELTPDGDRRVLDGGAEPRASVRRSSCDDGLRGASGPISRHFIHSPFYVYAYAFGDCLVNSLYAVYQNAERGFQDKYFEMLRAGGTKRHSQLSGALRPRRHRPRLLADRTWCHQWPDRRTGNARRLRPPPAKNSLAGMHVWIALFLR